MAEANQVPATLDLKVGLGDDWSYLLDYDIDLTGYTFSAVVAYYTTSAQTVSISVANTDLANGQITLSLTDTQITTIGPGTHKWHLTHTVSSNSRRILAGTFTVVEYP